MSNNNILVLAGALVAGVSYIAGKKAGKKETLCKFQAELLKIMVDHKKEGSK